MATAKAKARPTRKRNRKARTEVLSGSSSTSSSESEREPSPFTTQLHEPAEESSDSAATLKPLPAQPAPKQSLEAFGDFYIRQATKEFGDDLIKLRNAKDFNAGSVEILVAALRQGTACFGEEEKVKIGGGV